MTGKSKLRGFGWGRHAPRALPKERAQPAQSAPPRCRRQSPWCRGPSPADDVGEEDGTKHVTQLWPPSQPAVRDDGGRGAISVDVQQRPLCLPC